MPRKLHALLLADAVATSPDGKLTLYGIFEVVNCRSLPTRIAQLSIYWKIYSDEKGDISIRVEKPDGTDFLSTKRMPAGVGDQATAQGVTTFAGIEFAVSGDYKVRLLFNGAEELGSTTFSVREIGAQGMEAS
jgi:hypothetical protein